MAVALRNNDDNSDDMPMSEMNVTPLVDVMLVLLIIFMVAAPLMAAGVPVDLPKTQAKQINDQKPPLAVSVDAGGKYFIETNEVPSDQLLTALRNHSENALDRRIHVRADKGLPYGQILEVMGQINAAGFTKVALVSEAPRGPALAAPAAGAGAPPGNGVAATSQAPAPAQSSAPAAPVVAR